MKPSMRPDQEGSEGDDEDDDSANEDEQDDPPRRLLAEPEDDMPKIHLETQAPLRELGFPGFEEAQQVSRILASSSKHLR